MTQARNSLFMILLAIWVLHIVPVGASDSPNEHWHSDCGNTEDTSLVYWGSCTTSASCAGTPPEACLSFNPGNCDTLCQLCGSCWRRKPNTQTSPACYCATAGCSSGVRPYGNCQCAIEPYCETCGDIGANCDEANPCCSQLACNDGTCGTTPLLINLANSSANYQLTSAADGVLFDLAASGSPQQVAWTQAASDIAFLALDRNGNGVIDDASELFGNVTPLSSGSHARNGFDALLDLDGGPELSDGRIDSSDDIYDRLRLWLDRNHNGVSEAAELLDLRSAKIAELLLFYRETSKRDQHGNLYRYAGEARVQMNAHQVTRLMFDVILKVAR